MPLAAATLSTQLQNMTPVSTEAAAKANFANAFDTYFQDASVAGTPVGGSTSAAKSAMTSALTGMSASGAGALAIQNGIIAYWGVIIPAAVTLWTTAPPIISATPPPTLSTIAAALSTVFASNTASKLSLKDSCDAIAAVLHPLQLGGIAILGPPPPGGTPMPIL